MWRNVLFNVKMGFRKWMRNRTRPITIEEAEDKKYFWSRIYVACGAATCILLTIKLGSETTDYLSPELPVSKSHFRTFKDDEKFRVVKFSGFTKIEDQILTKQQLFEAAEKEKKQFKGNPKLEEQAQ